MTLARTLLMSDKCSTAADILVETLIRWNVDVIFGMPGDGINGIVEALRVRQDRVRFVVARHEEAAAFMACAYATWTGRLGCCLATTGPGTLASMGGGLPYAIAAAIAFPNRQVVAIVGDGGFSMSVAELATCVRYGLAVKTIVINNSSLAQIKWEQLMFLGNPEYGCDLQPVNFARVAEGFGVRGFRIEDPEQCGAVLDEALAHDRPVVIDAVVDANEPMLPPRRREDFVKKLHQALERGTPGRSEIEKALQEEPAIMSLRD